jgi:hypothetical protein
MLVKVTIFAMFVLMPASGCALLCPTDAASLVGDLFNQQYRRLADTWLITNKHGVDVPDAAWVDNGFVTAGTPRGSVLRDDSNTFYLQPRSGPIARGTLTLVSLSFKVADAGTGQNDGATLLAAGKYPFVPGLSSFIHMVITRRFSALTWWEGRVIDQQLTNCRVTGSDSVSGSVFTFRTPLAYEQVYGAWLSHTPGTVIVMGGLPDGQTFICLDPHADSDWGNLPIWEEFYDSRDRSYPLIKNVRAWVVLPCL